MMFSVETDRAQRLLRATLWGFWTVETVSAFRCAEQEAASAAGWKSGEFNLLVNTVDYTLQSQEVVTAFQAFLADAKIKAWRIAVAKGGSLSVMQTRRIVGTSDRAAHFVTVQEAEDWLRLERRLPVGVPPTERT